MPICELDGHSGRDSVPNEFASSLGVHVSATVGLPISPAGRSTARSFTGATGHIGPCWGSVAVAKSNENVTESGCAPAWVTAFPAASESCMSNASKPKAGGSPVTLVGSIVAAGTDAPPPETANAGVSVPEAPGSTATVRSSSSYP